MWLPTLGAFACPVCFASKNESRVAYYVTTAVLLTLPWVMIAGFGLCYRSLARRKEDPRPPAPNGPPPESADSDS
ncbi:MAG TPA: hypothetical protein DCM86_10285 [Verrucomicrobiales bacterium]|nr:hypothetical protein [Verrucomicrobiales bacterium]